MASKNKGGVNAKGGKATPNIAPTEPSPIAELVAASDNFILDCAMNGNLEHLVRFFEEFAESAHNLLNARSPQDGKLPLDWAAVLGHADVAKELLTRGAEINAVSDKGC